MWEAQYATIAKNLQAKPIRSTRNALTKSDFGKTLTVRELEKSQFPILHGRKMFIGGIVGELAAFLKGPKSIADFEAQGCNYWGLWGKEDGTINVDYGNSWLDFNGVNQLEAVVNSLATDPYGRRHLITGWKPDNLSDLDLPCCHYAYQWYVTVDGKLEMMWHQRSADWMIGTPSDVVLAALWNILMAQTVGLTPGKIVMTFGDSHLYESHFDQIPEYLNQVDQVELDLEFATWKLDPTATVFNFVPSMFELVGYNPMPAIKFNLES